MRIQGAAAYCPHSDPSCEFVAGGLFPARTRLIMFMEEVPGKSGMSEMSSASTQPVAHMSTAGVNREACAETPHSSVFSECGAKVSRARHLEHPPKNL